MAVTGATPKSLAVDGAYVYWTQGAVTSSAIYRTSQASPGAATTVVSSGVFAFTFATDGTNVYYADPGNMLWSAPAAGGGTPTMLAPSHGAQGVGTSLSVANRLMVWTDRATIWGMVVP